MRLGMLAALIFIVLALGFWFSSATNNSGISPNIQADMNTMMSATKVTQQSSWSNFITMVAAPFKYFDSIVDIAWSAFNTPIFNTGEWSIVPFFAISPFEIVLFFGLIILLLYLLRLSLS